jgi:hypothetical protein
MSGPGAQAWRDALVAMADPGVTAVLTVQCGLDWLRPGTAPLRDEIDEAITALAIARPGVRADRIVVHSLPAIGDIPPDELAELNRAHADWLWRLGLVGVMLPDAARPRVHRAIVAGTRHSVDVVDGFELQVNGAWPYNGAVAGALGLIRRAGATPLTGYDVDLDGPFGDLELRAAQRLTAGFHSVLAGLGIVRALLDGSVQDLPE